jgi:hypothetical protein
LHFLSAIFCQVFVSLSNAKQKMADKKSEAFFVKHFLSAIFCQVRFCIARFPKKQQNLLKIYRNKIGFINHKNLVKYLSGAFLHRQRRCMVLLRWYQLKN